MDATGPGPYSLLPINLWWTQLPISVIFTVLNVVAVLSGPSAAAPKKKTRKGQ